MLPITAWHPRKDGVEGEALASDSPLPSLQSFSKSRPEPAPLIHVLQSGKLLDICIETVGPPTPKSSRPRVGGPAWSWPHASRGLCAGLQNEAAPPSTGWRPVPHRQQHGGLASAGPHHPPGDERAVGSPLRHKAPGAQFGRELLLGSCVWGLSPCALGER